MGKQHRVPTPPSQFVAGIPMDLEELCLELLRIRPEDRPSESEIRQQAQRSPGLHLGLPNSGMRSG